MLYPGRRNTGWLLVYVYGFVPERPWEHYREDTPRGMYCRTGSQSVDEAASAAHKELGLRPSQGVDFVNDKYRMHKLRALMEKRPELEFAVAWREMKRREKAK